MNFEEIENEIRSIKGNGPVLEHLYALLESGEGIALVGAGASAGLWPLWNEFLLKFIDFSLNNDKIKKDEANYFRKEIPNTPLETAQQIRNKTGEPLYFEFLYDTFKDIECPQTGGTFTPTHKALMQLPIRNYLTLNYDAGLTNARTALYPNATTSYYFWDQEQIDRILDRSNKRQVLHCHGRYDLPKSIILTLDDYRRAYNNRGFVRLLDAVFAFEKLLIVGFGMSDPYIKQLFNNISADYLKSPLKHIAFVGLDDKNLAVTHLLRERVEMVYGARILFYPARDHHKALTEWLSMFVEKFKRNPKSNIVKEIEKITTPPNLKMALPDLYIHDPTDDENFKGRKVDFITLNRWATDPATRIIAITGIGGQGKTALVGRWLKKERTKELSQIPVFYWSFYEDMDVGKFLKEMVKFCLPIVKIKKDEESNPISFILEVVSRVRFVFVLDGLEVLQEEAGGPSHGRINHPELALILQQWLRYHHKGLMVLTSRFRFPDIERFSGVGFHHLNLVRLYSEDGVSLLEKLGIRGDGSLKQTWVENLYGHPLALRVLASTVKRCCYGDLAEFEGKGMIPDTGDNDPLSKKLRHLLSFYENQLKGGQRELLGIVSLFKRPVEIKSFVTLLKGMKSLKNTPLASAETSEIEKQLELLVDDFLVEKTREGITTHPVIRDYFRQANKIPGSRKEVADFLQSRPGSKMPENIEEVRDFVEAVQLLCEEGDFKAADDLFTSRLVSGGYGFNVFRDNPAVAEGLECVLAFVGDEERIQKVEEILGKDIVGLYYSEVSLYNYYMGNLTRALEWRNKSLEIYLQMKDRRNQAISLHNISLIEMEMGDIGKARETVIRALKISHETRELGDLSTKFACKAYYEFLMGDSIAAYKDFEIALLYEQKRIPDEQQLSSIWGNYQSEFLIRIQAFQQFMDVNEWNIKNCKEYHLNDKLALCRLLQGWYEILQGRFSDAEGELNQSERILRSSNMVGRILRLDWVWGFLYESRGEYQKGLDKVNDALFISGDKGYRLWHSDHLVLRGRLRILKFQSENQKDSALLEKAGDDANEALRIAEQTGYIWAKIEALELLSLYHKTRFELSRSEGDKEYSSRYAKQAASLKPKLFLTKQQMEDLKIQTQKEFEEQTSGWK